MLQGSRWSTIFFIFIIGENYGEKVSKKIWCWGSLGRPLRPCGSENVADMSWRKRCVNASALSRCGKDDGAIFEGLLFYGERNGMDRLGGT